MSNFSWIQTHKELAGYLKDKEDEQKELVDILREAGVTAGLIDEKPKGNRFDLEEIDPFTFFCFIYKYGPEKRLQILQNIASELDLHYPEDELGIPSAQAQKVMMFPFKDGRNDNEIENLWQFFYSALDDSITDDQFESILNQYGVGPVKITETLFYVAPDTYMPINGPTKPYLKEVLGIDPSFTTWKEYLDILSSVKQKSNSPFYEISYEAWAWLEEQKRLDKKYQIFQELVDRYKQFLGDEGIDEERYKWEAVHHFLQTFDIEADDFTENLKAATSKAANLVYQNSTGFIRKAVTYYPEDVRGMFKVLYDESKPLLERYQEFVEASEELLPKVIEKHGKQLNHQQDERTISYYLTMRYPDKYPLYKNETYKYLISLFDDQDAKPAGEKLFHYLELAEDLVPVIESDGDVIDMVEDQLTEECFQGEQQWLVFQDVLWINMRSIDTSKYWVFQGNPNVFDVEQALKDKALTSWRVNAHKAKITPGDKVILWVTGDQSGCYALAEVESDVHEDAVNEAEVPYYSDAVDDEPFDQVQLRITHNLAEDPITKEQVNSYEKLAGLNVGNRGTNFSATQEEYEALVELAVEVTNESKTDKMPKLNYPLNTIFYGPPGTGKTYTTIKRAAEIVKRGVIEDYNEAKEIFNNQLGETIEFITFHQNYSYEDFIQGLRPDTENDKELTFDRVDGLFKELADKALKNYEASKRPQTKKKSFEDVFNSFIDPLVQGEVEEIEVEMKRVSYFITAVTNRSIEFRKASGGTSHTLSISTLRRMYEAENVLEIQGLSSYYSPLLDKLLDMGKSPGETETVERKNYVLIIDEINRANISRVFGELITLIEPDKRYGREMHIPARLPSGESFSVPENLYIIGTMNTADKSIALLDIALRRRFEFEAMYPKYEINGEVIHNVEVLKKINERIIKLKGHDFQIGHSYFMKNHMTLKQRMNRRVIPLLLEYFMNDEEEVKNILEHAGLTIKENTWPLEITGKA